MLNYSTESEVGSNRKMSIQTAGLIQKCIKKTCVSIRF